MSFLPINEQNQQAPTGQTQAGMPPPQGGGSAGAGQAGGGATGSATGSPTQFGSSASKLGDYLSANAPQIQGQADKVVGGLNQQYGQVQGDIANAANQFGQQVQGGYTAPNQDVVNQAIANPTQFAANPDNVKAFQSQYNNAYTGPQNYESSTPYGNIQGEVNQAVQNAGLLNTQAGLGQYLGKTQGGNQTQASNTLDTLLLQGNPQAQQSIKNAAGQFKGLTDQFGQSVTGANQSVQAAQKAAQDAQKYAQETFNPYVQNFGNQINQGAQTAEQQRQAYNQALNQFYEQAVPVEQRLNQWAGTTYGTPTLNDPFAPIIAQNNQNMLVNPITAQNFATPEQYQQAAAIQQLLGGTGQLPIGQDTLSQAGTAPNVPQGSTPNLHDLLMKDFPDIFNAKKESFNAAKQAGAANKGDVLAKGVDTQYNDLLNYLNSVDPNFSQAYS